MATNAAPNSSSASASASASGSTSNTSTNNGNIIRVDGKTYIIFQFCTFCNNAGHDISTCRKNKAVLKPSIDDLPTADTKTTRPKPMTFAEQVGFNQAFADKLTLAVGESIRETAMAAAAPSPTPQVRAVSNLDKVQKAIQEHRDAAKPTPKALQPKAEPAPVPANPVRIVDPKTGLPVEFPFAPRPPVPAHTGSIFTSKPARRAIVKLPKAPKPANINTEPYPNIKPGAPPSSINNSININMKPEPRAGNNINNMNNMSKPVAPKGINGAGKPGKGKVPSRKNKKDIISSDTVKPRAPVAPSPRHPDPSIPDISLEMNPAIFTYNPRLEPTIVPGRGRGRGRAAAAAAAAAAPPILPPQHQVHRTYPQQQHVHHPQKQIHQQQRGEFAPRGRGRAKHRAVVAEVMEPKPVSIYEEVDIYEWMVDRPGTVEEKGEEKVVEKEKGALAPLKPEADDLMVFDEDE